MCFRKSKSCRKAGMSIQHLLTLLVATSTVYAEPLPCPPQSDLEPLVYMSEFKWGQTLEQMRVKFKENYESGKRLKARAYFDESEDSYVLPKSTGKVKISANTIRNITRHVEHSLERRYADFVFFPDMGHSHFFVPNADWASISDIPPDQQHLVYSKLLSLPGLKVLYHTAEQLSVREGERGKGPFPQDKILLWRYFSRNPIGDNVTGDNVAPYFAFTNQSYNTIQELKDHRFWSGGFSISASKDGCFAYKSPDDKIYRFDLSLEDLPYSPGGNDDFGANIKGRLWIQHQRDFGLKSVR